MNNIQNKFKQALDEFINTSNQMAEERKLKDDFNNRLFNYIWSKIEPFILQELITSTFKDNYNNSKIIETYRWREVFINYTQTYNELKNYVKYNENELEPFKNNII